MLPELSGLGAPPNPDDPDEPRSDGVLPGELGLVTLVSGLLGTCAV